MSSPDDLALPHPALPLQRGENSRSTPSRDSCRMTLRSSDLQRQRLPSLRMTSVVTLLVLVVCVPSVAAQATNAERELSRLQAQAEEAMAQGDPQGAAISIGRAALLASQFSKQQNPQTDHPPYRLMVDLFRTQEQVYRAMALFQQSGERTPVSSGICSLLSLGGHHAARALENNDATTADPVLHESLHQQTAEWLETVRELQQEWDCRQ